jgi:hypothetical protein
MTKRNISRQEMVNLNPGVNLDRLKGVARQGSRGSSQQHRD